MESLNSLLVRLVTPEILRLAGLNGGETGGDSVKRGLSRRPSGDGLVRAAGLEPALPKEADFHTTSASAAAFRIRSGGVRGLDYPLAVADAMPAVGPARLVSTPSPRPEGLARDRHRHDP